jgi:hypothetical protein
MGAETASQPYGLRAQWSAVSLRKSCMASSARTPPVIAIGAKGAFGASSVMIVRPVYQGVL